MSLINRLIDNAVKCLTCGASFGKCDCAEKRKAEREAEREAFIEKETARLLALPLDAFEAECRAVGVWSDATSKEASVSAEDVLNARHLVATAAGNIAACSAQVARALAWQRGQEVSVINDLETTIKTVERAHRQLIDAVNELRIATKK